MLLLLLMGDWGKGIDILVKLTFLVTIAPLLVRGWTWYRDRQQLGYDSEESNAQQVPDKRLGGWATVWIATTMLLWIYLLSIAMQLSA